LIVVVHEFKEEFAKGTPRTVCVGPRDRVQNFLSADELSHRFGGHIVYANTTTGQELLGVWGARKAMAFRSLLRVQGASLTLKRTRPNSIRLKLRAIRGDRKGACRSLP
jgi:hypothetical protein